MAPPAKKQDVPPELDTDNVATQTLLNALQFACSKLEEQSQQLSNACHIMQHLHSPSSNADLSNGAKRYEHAINCAIKAWRSASAAYAAVFSTVVTSTGAQPSTSQIGKRHHSEFVELARLSLLAKNHAHGLGLYGELVEEGGTTKANDSSRNRVDAANDDDHSSSASELPAENGEISMSQTAIGATSRKHEPRNTHDEAGTERQRDKIKGDPKGHKRLPHRTADMPDNLKANIKSTNLEKNEWRAEKSRHRREKKRTKRFEKSALDAADRDKTKETVEDTSKPVSERYYTGTYSDTEPKPVSFSGQTNHIVPKVEYEDIFEEVEARLEAKQAKREAAKKEKKRKRESNGSFIEGGFDGKRDQPVKKKVKNGDEDGSQVTNPEKRKKDEHQDEDANDSQSGSKRRKTRELS